MGDLITMTRATRPSRGVIATGQDADILFFTGVRYERMPEPSLSKPSAAKRRRPDAISKAELSHIEHHV